MVRYNWENYKALNFEYIDCSYQIDLSHTCLASLFEYYAQEKQQTNPVHKIFAPDIVKGMYQRYYNLKKEQQKASWKSFCYTKKKNLEAAELVLQKSRALFPN